MFTASILALVISSSVPMNTNSQAALSNVTPVYLIAEYDPNDDPGKDLTPDPHDEIHDKDLPANNPDDYLSGDTYPPVSGSDE